MIGNQLNKSVSPYEGRLFIGKVLFNEDPLKLNRVKVFIPGVMEGPPSLLPWVAPNNNGPVPNGRLGAEFYGSQILTPPIDSELIVEFQDGNPQYSLWPASPVRFPIPELTSCYPYGYGFKDPKGNWFLTNTLTGEVKYVHFSGTTIVITPTGTINVKSVEHINMTAVGNITQDAGANIFHKAKHRFYSWVPMDPKEGGPSPYDIELEEAIKESEKADPETDDVYEMRQKAPEFYERSDDFIDVEAQIEIYHRVPDPKEPKEGKVYQIRSKAPNIHSRATKKMSQTTIEEDMSITSGRDLKVKVDGTWENEVKDNVKFDVENYDFTVTTGMTFSVTSLNTNFLSLMSFNVQSLNVGFLTLLNWNIAQANDVNIKARNDFNLDAEKKGNFNAKEEMNLHSADGKIGISCKGELTLWTSDSRLGIASAKNVEIFGETIRIN